MLPCTKLCDYANPESGSLEDTCEMAGGYLPVDAIGCLIAEEPDPPHQQGDE